MLYVDARVTLVHPYFYICTLIPTYVHLALIHHVLWLAVYHTSSLSSGQGPYKFNPCTRARVAEADEKCVRHERLTLSLPESKLHCTTIEVGTADSRYPRSWINPFLRYYSHTFPHNFPTHAYHRSARAWDPTIILFSRWIMQPAFWVQSWEKS